MSDSDSNPAPELNSIIGELTGGKRHKKASKKTKVKGSRKLRSYFDSDVFTGGKRKSKKSKSSKKSSKKRQHGGDNIISSDISDNSSSFSLFGGKRKMKKSSKKASKKSSKKSKRTHRGGGDTDEMADQELFGGKRKMKSSKKSSKKMSKKMSRELPPALKVYQAIVAKVKEDVLKQGIDLKGVTTINSFVGKYSQMAKKENISLDKLESFIMAKYEADKKAGKLKEMFVQIEKESAEKKAAKKAAKAQMSE